MSTPRSGSSGTLYPALPGFERVRRYWDESQKMQVANIVPGQYYVTLADEMITTVLGSCVAACIRDPQRKIGGMNHFMLPMRNNANETGNQYGDAATRYGNFAMEHLINTILKFGGKRDRLEIKLFGGGRVLAEVSDIGRRNIDFVQQYVRTENLVLLADDLGGPWARKVVYFPLSGRVRIKKITSLTNETVIQRERSYLDDLQQEPVEGEVDLF